MKILSTASERSKFSGLMFLVAWWIGAATMVGGLEGLPGLLQNVLATSVFAAACALWWWAYTLSNFRNQWGFVVIGLWTVGPLSALLDFRYYVKNFFFWASAAILLSLIIAVGVSERPFAKETQTNKLPSRVDS
jgi:hypothetical protein